MIIELFGYDGMKIAIKQDSVQVIHEHEVGGCVVITNKDTFRVTASYEEVLHEVWPEKKMIALDSLIAEQRRLTFIYHMIQRVESFLHDYVSNPVISWIHYRLHDVAYLYVTR